MKNSALKVLPQVNHQYSTVIIENLIINTFYPDGFLEELEMLCKQYEIGECELSKQIIAQN
jgi:hypothetical protein